MLIRKKEGGVNFKMKSKFLALAIFIMLIIVAGVTATDCWEYGDDQNSCEDASDCNWRSDSWGGWCEQYNCYSLYTQTECSSTSIPGKNCTWQSSSDWGWCEMTSCWSFEGTNQTACESNTDGLTCEWQNQCNGYNPSTSCYDITTAGTCANTSGCSWGQCQDKGCWNYNTGADACTAETGSKGQNCTWNTQSSYCSEKGCWDYTSTNQTACESNVEGMTCLWKNDMYNSNQCQEAQCWSFDYTNATVCVNNTYNLSCTWGGQYCASEGCWNQNEQSGCDSTNGCSWKTSSGSGWCEEVQCWSWDGWNGGDANACVNNSYGMDCVWEDWGDNGACYLNVESSTCSNITTERGCMDTFYCWWQYTDMTNTSAGGTCNSPDGFAGGFTTDDNFFKSDNPGCYIFDGNETKCNSTIGCNYSATGLCGTEVGHAYESQINAEGINCSMVNASNLCTSVVLGSCCQWSSGNCTEDRVSTSCRDQADKFLQDLGFGDDPACADVGMKTSDETSGQSMCDKLRSDGGMPCGWNNASKVCEEKDDIYGNRTKSCDRLDSSNSCSAAGCKWITENYCEGNISVPVGRCEKKTGTDERNCKVACHACEFKYDGSAHNSSSAAKDYCMTKNPKCDFTEDSTAANGFGSCEAKGNWQTGTGGDCKSSCGSCTFMGNPEADKEYDGEQKSFSTCKTPKCYCEQAYEFDNVKCKWDVDADKAEGGNCLDSSEKTCTISCDRCESQADCMDKGRSALNATGSCNWDSDNSVCAKAGETVEVCWDAIDNDNDGEIDCADSGCYSDSSCGFVTGDCFGWGTQNQCETNDCVWITDAWGSWCDFKGADCWKYDGNSSGCTAATSCDWSTGTGEGQCEQDWNVGQDCYSLDLEANCVASGANCTWTNDTWCQGDGADNDWCTGNGGGWCDPAAYAATQCWLGDNTNSTYCSGLGNCYYDDPWCMEQGCWNFEDNRTGCEADSDCSWRLNDWGAECQVDWGANCWQFNTTTCASNGCAWRNDTWGGWCDNKFSKCWDLSSQDSCALNLYCAWNDWMWRYDSSTGQSIQGACDAKCWDDNSVGTEESCSAVSGCRWSDGWCESTQSSGTGGIDCWDYNDNSTDCASSTSCKWKNPGWCNPTGFAGGDAGSGKGSGAKAGMECWKYDGNQTGCSSNPENMTCTWETNNFAFCEPDWGSNCWQYSWNQTLCDGESTCYWNPENGGGCSNSFDQCRMNATLQMNETLCNANGYCNWTNNSYGGPMDGETSGEGAYGVGMLGHCEPSCFSAGDEASCGSGCNWLNGICNSPGMATMFGGMEAGAPTNIAGDICDGTENTFDGAENVSSAVDLCGVGIKDMDNAFGFGSSTKDFSQAGICNNEKVGFGLFAVTGSGNVTTKLFVYLDTDGSTTGGCSLSHNSSLTGYEFMLKHLAVWNSTNSNSVESFNAYKCSSGTWVVADISLSAWKSKMCGEVQGPMLAADKSDLENFPTLYNSQNDLRVYLATADGSHNASSPSDTAGPGWMTPGAVDFSLNSFSGTDTDSAQYGGLMEFGYGRHEDCFSAEDDDEDGFTNCDDWDCADVTACASTGVNAAEYVDSSTPTITGVKVEEYTDAALITYATSKPANGTLLFYYNDSTCTTLNATIYDRGILSTNMKNYSLWHSGEIYNDSGVDSLSYDLVNDTVYYYKLKICDDNGKCGKSACTSLRTAQNSDECAYCNFVTQIKAPTGWNVYYDLDRDDVYEHSQGQICGPNAGMKTNYTSGRRANVILNSSDVTFVFSNVTLTKTGLTSKVSDINNNSALINFTALTDSSGNTLGAGGMNSTTRDKIINNLYPEVCQITIPRASTACTVLWHCDDSGDNCVDRTAEASLINSTTTTCTWQLPYCEFSMWAGGEPGTSSSSSSSSSSSGGGSSSSGGGGGVIVPPVTEEAVEETVTEDSEEAVEEAVEDESAEVVDSATESAQADDQASNFAGMAFWNDLGDKFSNPIAISFGILVVAIMVGLLVYIYFHHKHGGGDF